MFIIYRNLSLSATERPIYLFFLGEHSTDLTSYHIMESWSTVLITRIKINEPKTSFLFHMYFYLVQSQDCNAMQQSVHAAATWQNIKKYLLPYNQTTEQLHLHSAVQPCVVEWNIWALDYTSDR